MRVCKEPFLGNNVDSVLIEPNSQTKSHKVLAFVSEGVREGKKEDYWALVTPLKLM